VWLSVWSEIQIVCLVQLMPLRPRTPSSLASFTSRLVLPFWYQLTQVVMEKRPINGRSVVVFITPPPFGAFWNSAIHLSVRRLSVPWRSCLRYRHAGCLQLSHQRCRLWTRPRTDVDPPRFLPLSNCSRRVGILSLAVARAIPCYSCSRRVRPCARRGLTACPALETEDQLRLLSVWPR